MITAAVLTGSGTVTVIVNDCVTSSVPSLTNKTIALSPPSVSAGIPDKTPDAASNINQSGNVVADIVKVSPSASVAANV